jgi:hypothetical protein
MLDSVLPCLKYVILSYGNISRDRKIWGQPVLITAHIVAIKKGGPGMEIHQICILPFLFLVNIFGVS